MKIEILYPEICDLYGELGNIRYLKKSVPDTKLIETHIGYKPVFLSDESPDLVYMGSMTEESQLIVRDELMDFTDDIKEKIDSGVRFLITGNALEIFGRGVSDADGKNYEMLSIFDFHTKRDMLARYNSLFIGEYGGIKIVGYQSQFTHSYYDSDIPYLFNVVRGPGFNTEIKKEGIHVRNFMATYIIGPILILNPLFTKKILKDMGANNNELAFEHAALEAYEARLKEYSDPSCGFVY